MREKGYGNCVSMFRSQGFLFLFIYWYLNFRWVTNGNLVGLLIKIHLTRLSNEPLLI